MALLLQPNKKKYNSVDKISLRDDFGCEISVLGIQNYGNFCLKVPRFKRNFLKIKMEEC